MTATVTQLPVRQPQPDPDSDSDSETSAFLSLLSAAFRAEGRRLAYEEMGIPQPPRSRSSVLAFTGPAS